ncbi:MAG: hypothetical protein Q7J84_10545 [Sulfuricaulis sp.]|nr:hypothetical protein [Sulfuricaulis sp.]
MNRLICMTFDGDYVTEGRDFADVDAAWCRASDMGSRWYFYPWCFVTSESGKTIAAAPDGLHHFEGRRVATVQKVFAALAALPETEGVEADEFTGALMGVSL